MQQSIFSNQILLPNTDAASWLTSLGVSTYMQGILASADQGALQTALGLSFGTYTPTLTNVANLSASTPSVTAYMRIGTTVIVGGSLQADAVAAGSTNTNLGVSLPIASALTTPSQLGGAAIQASGRQPIEVLGDATNDRANFFWVSQSTANENISFIFAYQVI